jgi:hypothetical protein
MKNQEFKEQDKVIDIITGKNGIISKINHIPIDELIVLMNGIDSRYNLDGKYNDTDKYPRLLHFRTDYDYSKIDFNNLPQRQYSGDNNSERY